MRKNYFETMVGVMTIIVGVAFILFSMKITNRKVGQKFYRVYARFGNINGITPGTKVKIGGVDVGNVQDVLLENDYAVLVSLDLKVGTKIPIDSCIKVSTSGLIGKKYLKIDVGGEDDILKDGGMFDFTESSMDLEDMIARFLLGKVSNDR
jgi:phospholipid/cholesterol/gamma-HCH transport system substrate-binding protein